MSFSEWGHYERISISMEKFLKYIVIKNPKRLSLLGFVFYTINLFISSIRRVLIFLNMLQLKFYLYLNNRI